MINEPCKPRSCTTACIASLSAMQRQSVERYTSLLKVVSSSFYLRHVRHRLRIR